MDNILVVGASGTVGLELVRILKSKGHNVIHATSKVEDLKPNQVHLNVVTKVGLKNAFEGVDKAFFLSPPGYANQHELLIPLIEQAKINKLKKVVLMTAMGANAVDSAPMRMAEVYLEKSGLQYNIIRPNWFMQNFNTFWLQGILSQNKIFLPVGKAKGSFIDARDISAVAANLLENDKFNNQDFDLTGNDVLDHDQVAQVLSEVTGSKISFQDITSNEMLSGLLGAGLPKPYAEFLIMILGFFKLGYAERVTENVEKILGRKPIAFKQYAKDYKSSWVK